jgi:hypothetical protein
VVELGLLDLEEKFKGRIIGLPTEANERSIDGIQSENPEERERLETISLFVSLLTTHMKE